MRSLRPSRRVALCWALGAASCAQEPPAGFAALELASPPPAADMPIKLGYVFADAVELLGAKVTPRQALKPGARVEVTLYWRKRRPVPKGFRLFTHLLDAAGDKILNLDAASPLRQSAGARSLFLPSEWRDGKVYVDSFAFWVPSSVRTDSVSLVCGLFRDNERLPLSAGAPGKAAGSDASRALVTELSVTLPPASASHVTPTLWVPRRQGEIAIDGKLDDAGWTKSATTSPFVNVATGEAPTADEVTASVKLVYDEQALFLGFEVIDEDLRGGFDPTQPDPHLWLKDAIEIMIDPDGDGDNLDYYEIQVGPQSLVFDSQFDAYNLPRVEPAGPFGHQEWSANLTRAVQIRGTLDDAREDAGYVVELSIPWASFGKAKRVPPVLQDVWRMNFYAVQNNSGTAWSPILGQGNFHKASRFGRVHFAGPMSSRR